MAISEIILIIAGAFSIVCAIGNFDFFMNHNKAQFFIRIFGRTGTRIFYLILGLIIITLGILLATGVIPGKK